MASEVVGSGYQESEAPVSSAPRLGSHLLRVIRAYPKAPELNNGEGTNDGGRTNGGVNIEGKGCTKGDAYSAAAE